MNTIAEILLPEDICLDLDVPDKRQLRDEIGQQMQRSHNLPHDWVRQGLSRREQAGSTGVGEGVVIPHARVQGLERIQVSYIRLRQRFLAAYDEPVLLAVTDAAALTLALALGNAPDRETFIVSSAVADQAVALAHFASRAI